MAVGKIGRQQQQVLLLADLVRLLLVAGLGVLLEVRVLLGLEARTDIDEVGVEDRCAHASADVSPLGMMLLQEDYIHDLSNKGAAQEADVHPPHPALHLFGDVLGLFFGDAWLSVKLFG